MRKEHHYILENFNFGKVHQVMQSLNWTWQGKGVPSIQDLKRTAAELLADCDEPGRSVRTGGLRASCYQGECSPKAWELEFILEYTDSEWG